MGQKSLPVARYLPDPVHKKTTTETIKQGKSPNDRPVTPPTGNNTKSRRARVAAQTATQPTAPRKDWSWPTKIRRPSRNKRNHGPGSDPSVVSEEATSTSRSRLTRYRVLESVLHLVAHHASQNPKNQT